MPGLSQEELSNQYVTRASITYYCTLCKFPDSQPRSQSRRDCAHGTFDRSGHLLGEQRARSDSESLSSTAAKSGLGLEMREKKQGCTQTCHTMNLQEETTLKHLSQPLGLDI